MGLLRTKFDTAKFNNSQFDFTYDSDTFGSDAADDFDGILLEHGDVYYFYRQETAEDGMGNVKTITSTPHVIYGIFQDITLKDRQIQEMGLAVPGNRKFYFNKKYYTREGGVDTEYELKEGDYITDKHLFDETTNTGYYRVVKILKQWWDTGEEVYRVAIVQSINLDGS